MLHAPSPKVSKRSVLTQEQSASLFGWSSDPFEGLQYGLKWVSGGGDHYLLEIQGVAVSHVGILTVKIVADEKEFSVLGFGGVITHLKFQHRGYATLLMKYVARDNAETFKKSPGMLFCSEKMLGFYQKLGWRRKDNPVWVKQPLGEVRMPLHLMILNPAKLSWPQGSLWVLSLPW